MLFEMKCPSCGATMQFDDTRESMFCPYCGNKVVNIPEQININQNINVSGTVYHVQDRSNDPNLYISYNTVNPSVNMVTRIVDTGVKGIYVNGQTQTYHLSQGPHTIVLKIGKRNYNRDIVIPSDNSPVRIYASFDGHAQISIDQPHVSVSRDYTSGSRNTSPISHSSTYSPSFSGNSSGGGAVSHNYVPQSSVKTKSSLSILVFVLSLTLFLSWLGVIFAIVEIAKDKRHEWNHVLSYWAIGIGIVFSLYLPSYISKSINKKANDNPSQQVSVVTESDSIWALEPTAIENFKYYIDGDHVYLVDYIGNDKKVRIGTEYVIDGKTYIVDGKIEGLFAHQSVTSVIIPEGITEMENNTFNSCGVDYVYIPKSLVSVGHGYPFYKYFHDVQKIYFGGSEKEWNKLTGGAERSDIDVVEIIYDANIDDLIG